jgi:hypothetical protein
MMIENRVLRRIFEPKREEITEGLRKLYNENLHQIKGVGWKGGM